MNFFLSVKGFAGRAQKKVIALGKSLNQLARLPANAGDDDPERSVQEFSRLSGSGQSTAGAFVEVRFTSADDAA
jgi:hypothetical protein